VAGALSTIRVGAAPIAGAQSPSPVDRALDAYQQRHLDRTTVVRTLLFAVIWLWLLVNYGRDVALENLPVLSLFVLVGLAAWGIAHGHPERRWVSYVTILVDVLLLAYTLLTPGRTYPDEWPWQMVLRQPSFLYSYTILALATLTFRPLCVAWAGACITVVWALGTWLIAAAPGTVMTVHALGLDATAAGNLALYLDPRHVHLDDTLLRIFVTLVVTAILALAAREARRLIHQQAEAARERANLARYVAPSMVERLARMDRPLGAVRTQPAAVLFADLEGFTGLAEGLGAEASMQLLRDFHARMAEALFAHGGTLDKFIGDGLMATFGTPERAADDAARALACARSMLEAMAAWNIERRRRGEPALHLGIGLHYGTVTTGDVGGAGRFEFAVIGDTVNVASRLERLTRELDEPLLVSDALLAAAGSPTTAAGFRSRGSLPLRGRQEPLNVWGLAESKAAQEVRI
jgi:adenylate cyclase